MCRINFVEPEEAGGLAKEIFKERVLQYSIFNFSHLRKSRPKPIQNK